MKFLADENMDVAIVDRLRQDGHQVWYVVEADVIKILDFGLSLRMNLGLINNP